MDKNVHQVVAFEHCIAFLYEYYWDNISDSSESNESGEINCESPLETTLETQETTPPGTDDGNDDNTSTDSDENFSRTTRYDGECN